MSGFSSEQAALSVLLALGHPPHHEDTQQPRSLLESIQGSGLTLRAVALLGPILPEEEGQAGCLLEYADGSFLPVLGGGEEALVLDEKGLALRPIEPADLVNVVQLSLFIEQAMSTARIMPYLTRHKGKLFEIFACGIIINLFALTLPLFSSFVYDKVLGNGITDTMWAIVIGLGIIVAIELSVKVIRIIISERFARISEADIDHNIFRSLLDARANALPPVGSVIEKYKQILSYRDFLSSSYLLALADLPFLLLFLFTILLVSGPLVLVAVVCGVGMLLLNLIFMPPVFDYERQARRASEHRLGLMTDLLASREAMVGNALRDDMARRWRKASVAAANASSLARFWRGLGYSTTGSMSYLSYIGVLLGGVYMVEDHSLTSGGLLAASMLTSRAMGSFASVTTLVVRYHEFRTALQEMNKIFPATHAAKVKTVHGRLRGAIQLNNVSCRLGHGGHPVLKGISLAIQPGEMVGIAGAPGSGKTTLLRLITGLIHPDEGQVLIDHLPLETLSLADLSQTIGFKPQDLCLMAGTIEENVQAGRAGLTPESRAEILEISGLARSFYENGLSWTTDVGARGMNLSGGQRQLVALARAMLGAPPVLILDEPTNGLDSALEVHLAEQLLKRKGSATMLISTHSRSLLQVCDRIIVVGQSRLLADGPRDKVLVG